MIIEDVELRKKTKMRNWISRRSAQLRNVGNVRRNARKRRKQREKKKIESMTFLMMKKARKMESMEHRLIFQNRL